MLIAHHILLSQAEGAPGAVRLLPSGAFHAIDGRGPFTVANPAAVINASLTAKPLAIDENHAIDHAQRRGGEGRAVGWIVDLESRDDGIWGNVDWTPVGRQLMADRAYRGISPVIDVDDGKVVRCLMRAALTNTPAVLALQMFSEGIGMDLSKLRKALGLAEGADEAAILAAAEAHARNAAAATQQFSAIAVAAGLEASAAVETLVATLKTQHSGAGDVVKLTKMVTDLETELATIKATGAKDKAVAFVDGAIKGGKPIAARRDWWVERFVADPVTTQASIDALPSINDGGVTLSALPGGGSSADAPTALERQVAAQFGQKPEDVAARRRAREGRAA